MFEDNIKGFKLMNGGEMIAKVMEETDTHYVLDEAVYWDLVQVEANKWDVQFSPISVGAKMKNDNPSMDLSFPKLAILTSYEPRDEITARYKQLLSPIALL